MLKEVLGQEDPHLYYISSALHTRLLMLDVLTMSLTHSIFQNPDAASPRPHHPSSHPTALRSCHKTQKVQVLSPSDCIHFSHYGF